MSTILIGTSGYSYTEWVGLAIFITTESRISRRNDFSNGSGADAIGGSGKLLSLTFNSPTGWSM